MRFLFLISLFISIKVSAEDYSGLWVWEDNSKEYTFSIRIQMEGEAYKGSYCAVGMSGSRIDCSSKSSSCFVTKLDGDEFSFKTNYSSAIGKAKISRTDDGLVWVVVKSPHGEHYAPKTAKLKKSE